jgi:hypothetical protein
VASQGVSDVVAFGIVCEGITDQIVIRNVLTGHFNSDDVDLRYLVPARDATDESRIDGASGWFAVIDYVKNSAFRNAFQFLDYIILQIDTDVCEETHFDVPRVVDGITLDPVELIQRVRSRFRQWIGEEFFDQMIHRIVFAISVDSIECWLLPLYYTNVKRSKTVNCLNTLNEALARSMNFTISAKDPDYYERASSEYSRNRVLKRCYRHNPSFNAFVQELDEKCADADVETGS